MHSAKRTLARHAIAALAMLCALLPAQADTFRGTVSHVTDGDTLWVRPAQGGAPVELRLVDLDAPEGCQPYGPEARRALAGRVLNAVVTVRTRGVDTFHRALARVRLLGEDIGAWMVLQGHAWSGTYKGRNGPYATLEQQARRARRGLWAHPGAQDPRSFRRQHGRCV